MSDYKVSRDKPGYREKVIQCGNCTVTVFRPILDHDTQHKMEQKATDDIALGLRNYLRRKEQRK